MKTWIFLILIGSLVNQNAGAQADTTYMNPVIPGDHPDATLTRIGNDFYTTGSSFNITPVIYHSTDLVHWEAIAQPVKASWTNYGDNPGGGCWGGHMVYHKGKYWHYFSRANVMHFVTANDPRGPWSDPVMVNEPAALPYNLGYDNSVFIDDNGKWYLVVKNGQPNNGIVELGADGQPTGTVYDLDWLNPEPELPYRWAEGPVMWKYKGYYYYSFGLDLAGGQKVMRSETLTANEADWEFLGDFFDLDDPRIPGSLFASPNHASPAVMLDDSTHWVIHPLYAKGEWRGQGRQGLLNQVRYDDNLKPTADYPVNTSFTAPDLPSSGIPWMVPKSDYFNTDSLNPEWSFLGYTPDNTHSLSDRPGWFRLSPKNSTQLNTITKNDGEHNYSLITRLEFDPQSNNDEAGLWIMRGDEESFLKLYSSVDEIGRQVITFSFDDQKYEVDNTMGNTIWLKIVRVNHRITGYYSNNGHDWKQVGQEFDVSSIDSYSDFSTFTGTRQGLFVQDREAFFDLYIYRDAYTPVLAESPANQYGTRRTTLTDNIYHLDSIHHNDWALYAGVEFGNDEYLKAPKKVKITASSAGTGGTVEVWIDSIDTGTKIAECDITNTGDWETYETFTAPVDPINGRHDVYLKFTGASGERLFKLKWIEFIPETAPELESVTINHEDTLYLKLNQPVNTPSLPSGLSIEANGSQHIAVSNISLTPADSSQLLITLGTTISNTDELTISYDTGTITNPAGVNLMSFTEHMVDNRLPGAIPKLKRAETKNHGDTVWIYLSKNMNSPASHADSFTIQVEGKEDIAITSAELSESDSTVLILLPENRIYYEDIVSLTYTGNELASSNGGALPSFDAVPVQNTADGYPPAIESTSVRKRGSQYLYIDITFDRPVFLSGTHEEAFTITLNDDPVSIQNITVDYDSLSFLINPAAEYDDEIRISYSGNYVRSRYYSFLQDFEDYRITNTIPEPLNVDNYNREANDIMVFPNPAGDEVRITSSVAFTSLTIFDTKGKRIVRNTLDHPVRTKLIPLNLAQGIYLLQLQYEHMTGVTKLIVE